jgi:hypothetical protein
MRIFHSFFRLLFSICLFYIGYRGLTEVDDNKGFISQNIRMISEKFKINFLLNLRIFSELIWNFHHYCLMITSFLTIFGIKQKNYFIIIACLIEIILIHNIYFFHEFNFKVYNSIYIAIAACVITN